MKRFTPLAVLIVVTFGLFACVDGQTDASRAGANSKGASSQSMNQAPALPTKGVTWINSEPQSLEKLHGQVVLIDFWEYTCINCIRSFPFEKQLYKRFHDKGLEILGIHDPEFDIAYKTDNVRKAVKRFDLPWPVAADPKFAIWNAYNSHTWPNYFLIDQQGNLVKHWSGEGHDAQIERTIQNLLAKSNANFDPSNYSVEQTNWFTQACGDMTGETYVGRWHGRGALQDQGGYGRDMRRFHAENKPGDGKFVLNGKWQTAQNGTTFRGSQNHPPKSGQVNPDQSNAPRLTLKYHAREVYTVMNTAHANGGRSADTNKTPKAVKVYVTQDGRYLTKANSAADTQFDDQGRSYIMVRDPRMYYLVLNPKGKDASHTVSLWPSEPGLTINSFTFGNNCSINFAHLYSHQPQRAKTGSNG